MKESEYNSILAVPEGLPPGLWLPTAEESTTQYLREHFNHNNHSYEDIVDYGAFVVALIMWETENTQRVSLMPTTKDFRAMFHEGYGLSIRQLDNTGGVPKLQRALNFCPRGFRPERGELLERLEWLAQYALVASVDFDPDNTSFEQIIQWGAARNLLPSRDNTLDILGDKSDAKKIFSLERKTLRERYSFIDVYRFGAKVLEENSLPLSQDQLDKKYGDYFPDSPTSIIVALFGSSSNFWLEFGRIMYARALTPSQHVLLGVRHAITSGGVDLGYGTADKLARQRKLPHHTTLKPLGGVTGFRQHVHKGYDAYLGLSRRLQSRDIQAHVVQAVCWKFENTDDFEAYLLEHTETLQKLSRNHPASRYILKRIQEGLDLLDERIFEVQHISLEQSLQDLGISGNQRRFVYDFIPRINAEEMLPLSPLSKIVIPLDVSA